MEKILLVDDESDALEVLTWALEDWGCSVQTAMTGDEALRIGQLFRPTLLLTDYCLRGEVNGVDVIRGLRAHLPSLCAILMTGLPPNQLRAELRGLGEIPVVGKPFRWSELEALLVARQQEEQRRLTA
jgi:DNA-binding response OmpR family regulator